MLIATPKFASRIGAFIIDEAHCIVQWGGDFRPEYSGLEKFRGLVPKPVPFLVTSATLTPSQLERTRSNLSIEGTRSFHLNLGNDRPNIKQELRLMKSASDYAALDFIVAGATTREEIPRTIIFVNAVSKTHAVAHRLRAKVGELLRDEIAILHAHRAEDSKREIWRRFKDEEVRILVATEAAAMGMDVPDITLAVQFGVPENLAVWLQRAGRAGRSPLLEATAVMMVERSVVQRKSVEENLRAWIEAGGCRRSVADAYFNNPPRRTPMSPSRCCDNCAAAAAALSTGPSAPATATPKGPMAVASRAGSPARHVDNSLRPRLSPKRRKGTHLKTVKTALVNWRYTTRRTKYRFSSLKAENILPDNALTTIASLRRDLKTIHDLKRVLNPPWPHVDTHGG
ncbi:P-loop containing nucleoside triphosphate hydrolase protein, partial [Dichomitus squalens]